MGAVTTRAAALGFATTDDPALPVDPAAARMLPDAAPALAVAVAGGVLEVLLDHVPTAAELTAFETVSGCSVAVTVADPEVYQQVVATASTTAATARDLPALLADVPADAHAVHLRPGSVPAVRVRGAMQPLPGWPALSGGDVAGAIKFVTGAAPTRTDRTGAVFPWAGSRWRATTFPTAAGDALVLRRIHTDVPSLDRLGLPASVADIADLRNGLVVLAGPTSSGRSTTFSALVDRVNSTRRAWVATVEAPVLRPIQPRESVITQRSLGPDTADVATAVRTAAEAGADVIAVSAPLASPDDLDAVLSAASAGSLVLLAVKAADVSTALTHLLTLPAASYRAQAADRLGAVLRVAVGQQLLTSTTGSPLPAVEVLWANPALTAVVRGDRLAELDTAAAADASGRSTTMRSAVEALLSSGRLSAADTAVWRATHPATSGFVAATPVDDLEDEDLDQPAPAAALPVRPTKEQTAGSAPTIAGIVQPGQAQTRRDRRTRRGR